MRARNTLLVFGLLGCWSIWLVVAFPERWAVLAGGFVPLLVLWLGRRRAGRKEKQFEFPEDEEKPDRIAWIPMWCVIVAFMGYGITLTLVHSHYFEVKTSTFQRRVRAEGQERQGIFAAYLKRTESLIQQEKRLEREPASRLVRALEEERPELISVGRVVKAARGDLTKATSGLRRIHFTHKGPIYLLATAFEEEKRDPFIPLRLRLPSATELPPWFGRLGSFFTVATQLLAGLVIVLTFSRWRAGVSEAVWRTSMPIAVVGVAFGLAGNLPSLSRSMQAILLAPVAAGLAGAIGGLVVVAMESKISEN
jgi:hypothetical protein